MMGFFPVTADICCVWCSVSTACSFESMGVQYRLIFDLRGGFVGLLDDAVDRGHCVPLLLPDLVNTFERSRLWRFRNNF